MTANLERGQYILANMLRFAVVFLTVCLLLYWYGSQFGHREFGDLYSQNSYIIAGALGLVLAEFFLGFVLVGYLFVGLHLIIWNPHKLLVQPKPLTKLNAAVGAILLPLNFLMLTGFVPMIAHSDTVMAIPFVCWVLFNVVYRLSDRILSKSAA